MTSNSSVCVDASLLLKLWIHEDFSDVADRLRSSWAESGVQRYAPSLVDYEIVSALNQKLQRGSISSALADDVLELAFEEPLLTIDTNDLQRGAMHIAQRLGLRSTYDAHYLAVAEELNCEFWTADERLYNAMRDRFPLIRWVGAA